MPNQLFGYFWLFNRILSFGNKGERYDKILQRIYDMAVKTQLREFLMSSENFITVEEALREAEERWPKSK